MTFELKHFRYVVAAAEHKSFRRAAAALGVRESSISRRIRDLEERLGSALFARHCGGVTLTYAGKVFLPHAREVINQVDFAAKDIRTIGSAKDGILRIGVFSSLSSEFFANLIQVFRVEYRSVRLKFFEGAPSEHIAGVREHRLDVAFLTGRPPADGCAVTHLWDERVYIAMPESDRLAARDEVEWAALRDRRFVISETASDPELNEYLIKRLTKPGRRPSIQSQAVYRDMLINIVANGGGLALTNEATASVRFPGVVYRALTGETLPFCAVWSHRNANPAFWRFLGLAETLSKKRAVCSKDGPAKP